MVGRGMLDKAAVAGLIARWLGLYPREFTRFMLRRATGRTESLLKAAGSDSRALTELRPDRAHRRRRSGGPVAGRPQAAAHPARPADHLCGPLGRDDRRARRPLRPAGE